MFKKALLTLYLFFCLAMLSFHGVTFAAEWSEMDPGQDVNNDFYSVWGSAADDVFVVGTFGKKLHYDGNPAGTWVDQGKDSG
jgi:hypothetical protein